MSGDGRHPDLERFYEAIAADEDGDYFPDPDDEDDDYDLYLDAEDMDEEIDPEDDEDDEDMILDVDVPDDEDDEELVEEDDDEEDGEGDEASQQWLAQLFNSAGSTQARSNLLARLLAGSGSAGPGAGLRFRAAGTPEERARANAERRRKERWWTPQTEPHANGLALLRGGEFGRVDRWNRKRKSLGLPDRRRYICSRAQATIPNSHGTVVASYPSIPYVGQYAGEDYGLFYAATQNFTLHLYNTSQSRPAPPKPRPERGSLPPPSPENGEAGLDEEDEDDEDTDFVFGRGGAGRGMPREDTSMKKIKNVQGIDGRWTITDCDADKKAEKMIYSSITPFVHMLYTSEDDSEHIELDFSARRRREDFYGYDHFGLWSIRFSADGKEIVAGASDGKIMVYDIDAQQRSLSVPGHADDVNAVCFADESSTNILVSGADDGYVKVWDRRSLSSSTPSGVLVGATEGITYTSPKGDGRYIVANSKDQAARLYDLRKMRSHSEFEGEHDAVSRYGQPHYDYRNTRYPAPSHLAHPKDCSVMTYRGHSVLRTLIRCHFSPRENTGQSYIYSGSADGMIHIWSLDGRVVQVLNRAETSPLRNASGEYNDPSAPVKSRRATRYGAMPYEMGQSWTVRDVSWHGYEPTLMSTCWEVDGGYRRGGTLAKHEWKGLGKGGLRRLEDWVEKEVAEESG